MLFVLQANLPAHALNPIFEIHVHGPGCQPGCGSGNNPAPSPTGAPIDGGVSLLLAGGAAYAVRRIRKGNKQASAVQ
ncbi:PID-CTERM protein-sorting domain-containing protein [Hymenobacter norwichensis]|uniref:PID-CTERM protein-sorting domain-containing protein n=1 Tax=Hymenobacter norwichensis TaxID=223903 RepID=UPI003CCB9DC0